MGVLVLQIIKTEKTSFSYDSVQLACKKSHIVYIYFASFPSPEDLFLEGRYLVS